MSKTAGPSGSESILVVDDEPAVLSITCALLARSGYAVMQADCGERALEICDKGTQRVDLLLTDVVMPKMQGPELAQIMRELYPQIRVLFMSGYQDHRCGADASHGPARLLPKPFSPDALLNAVRAALDEPQKRGPGREPSGGGIRDASNG
jgi:two-component system cell cycle sensor histidine kinase/response regulator CckA